MRQLELLTALHKALRPETYLEIGSSTASSLALASYSKRAIGIGPKREPAALGNQITFDMEPGLYFSSMGRIAPIIDMAFIDDERTFAEALMDFINIEAHSHENTVVVLGGVLPVRGQGDAGSGGSWKIPFALGKYRPTLEQSLLDTFPSGSLVLRDLRSRSNILRDRYDDIVKEFSSPQYDEAPEFVFTRAAAEQPERLISKLNLESWKW